MTNKQQDEKLYLALALGSIGSMVMIVGAVLTTPEMTQNGMGIAQGMLATLFVTAMFFLAMLVESGN